MLLPVPLVGGLAIAGAAIGVPYLIGNHAVDGAVAEARRTVDEFKTLRAYYTESIVKKELVAISCG